MSDLTKRVGYTVMFLQMTATEMHKLAEATPEIARELGHIAEQVQVEADSQTETAPARGRLTSTR
jgi:nitric oxide reductase activation protein